MKPFTLYVAEGDMFMDLGVETGMRVALTFGSVVYEDASPFASILQINVRSRMATQSEVNNPYIPPHTRLRMWLTDWIRGKRRL